MMTRTRILLGVLLLLTLALGCTTFIEKNLDTFDAVIQLHEYSSDQFYCSATVVSKSYAVTAGHCVQQGVVIKISNSKGEDTGVTGTPIRASGQMDYAVIEGDFSKFKFIQPELDPKAIISSFYKGTLVACGYPMGGNLICFPAKKPGPYIFYFRAEGALYPGMSGGPVIDKKTGKLIGVNSAVYEGGILLAPIINLLFGLTL